MCVQSILPRVAAAALAVGAGALPAEVVDVAEPLAGAPAGAQIPRYRLATVGRRRPIFGGGTSPVRSKYPMTTSDIGRPLSDRFVRRNVS